MTTFYNDDGLGSVRADLFTGPPTPGTAPGTAHGPAVFPSGQVGLGLLSQAADALTAHSGGTQAAALLLSAAINRISTVAAANDSVKLPVSVAGMSIAVINGAASNSMQVFGSGADTINDVATATGVAQAAGKTASYYCPVAGKWYRLLSA